MKRTLAILALLASSSAFAADNAVIVTPGAGVTIRSIDVGAGVQAPAHVLVGSTGTAVYGTAGTANANVLTVQGIAAMTPLLTTVSGTVSTTAAAAAFTDGWDSTQGAKADAACATDNGTCSLIALVKRNNQNVTGPASIATWGGGTLGAMANYGAAGGPGSVLVPGVNAFITNANANGRNTSANSSPVVPSAAPNWYHLATTTVGTNTGSVKPSSTVVFSCQISNSTTTIGFFKIFNKASSPTLGTDTPAVTLIMPAPAAGGGGSNVEFGPGGLTLPLGFAVATTGGILDSDNTNAPAGISANCQYE